MNHMLNNLYLLHLCILGSLNGTACKDFLIDKSNLRGRKPSMKFQEYLFPYLEYLFTKGWLESLDKCDNQKP
jgi:hypothetical protein